jgi:putative hemolysin
VTRIAADIARAQALRGLCFRGPGRIDADAFDTRCHHLLVEDAETGALVACCRLLHLRGGSEIARSYSAQFYELAALESFEAPMMELGRFCIHPERHDPDILRLAWGALARFVDENGVGMLFGCSSFKAPRVVRFALDLARRVPDPRCAMATMPPLLRSYLAMGGWVSDHAVVDRDLGTLHVFTGLEIGAIPAARARQLRAVLRDDVSVGVANVFSPA